MSDSTNIYNTFQFKNNTNILVFGHGMYFLKNYVAWNIILHWILLSKRYKAVLGSLYIYFQLTILAWFNNKLFQLCVFIID